MADRPIHTAPEEDVSAGGEPRLADVGASDPALPSAVDLILAGVEDEELGERRRFRRAVLFAVAVHVVFLLITWPAFLTPPEPLDIAGGKKVFLRQQRFELAPSKPRPARKIPEKKARKIPIPDPTPDDPEPVEVENLLLPEIDEPDIGLADFGIPDAPPAADPGRGMVGGGYTGEAYDLGDGGIEAPVKVHSPLPRYTETARQAQIMGFVILKGVVDEEGNVRNLEVIRGLPQGLTESALETVLQWKYKPARKDGKPVPVYYFFRVRFSLQ